MSRNLIDKIKERFDRKAQIVLLIWAGVVVGCFFLVLPSNWTQCREAYWSLLDDHSHYQFNHRLADELGKGNWAYIWSFHPRHPPAHYISMYVGYLLGDSALTAHRWHQLLQIITLVLLYACGKRAGLGWWWAWLPLLFYALVEPVAQIYARLGPQEGTGNLYAILVFYSWIRAQQTERWKPCIGWVLVGMVGFFGAMESKTPYLALLGLPLSGLTLWALRWKLRKAWQGLMQASFMGGMVITLGLVKGLNALTRAGVGELYKEQFGFTDQWPEFLTKYEIMLWYVYGVFLFLTIAVLALWWAKVVYEKRPTPHLLLVGTVAGAYGLASILPYIFWEPQLTRYLAQGGLGLALAMGISVGKVFLYCIPIARGKVTEYLWPLWILNAVALILFAALALGGIPASVSVRVLVWTIMALALIISIANLLGSRPDKLTAVVAITFLGLLTLDFCARNTLRVRYIESQKASEDKAFWTVIESACQEAPKGVRVYLNQHQAPERLWATEVYAREYFGRTDLEFVKADIMNLKPRVGRRDMVICYVSRYVYELMRRCQQPDYPLELVKNGQYAQRPNDIDDFMPGGWQWLALMGESERVKCKRPIFLPLNLRSGAFRMKAW